MVTRLSDIALLNYSLELWLETTNMNEKISVVNWMKKSTLVAASVPNKCQGIPNSVHQQITDCVKIIGIEIQLLVDYQYQNCHYVNRVCNLKANELCWAPDFTIDRIKTICKTGKSNTIVEGFVCPYWVEKLWKKRDDDQKEITLQYFGNYRFFVFMHWVCYMKTFLDRQVSPNVVHGSIRFPIRGAVFGPYFNEHLIHFRDYYKDSLDVENVFRFLVIIGVVEQGSLFLNKIPQKKRRENVYLMAEVLLVQYNSKFFRRLEHALLNMMIFLWNNMDIADRIRLVQKHFTEFFHFTLTYPNTEYLIPYISCYNPIVINQRDNRRYLEKAVEYIQANLGKCLRHRSVFLTLYNKVHSCLSEIDIVNLLEKVLIIADINIAVSMVQVLEKEKKNLLLDAIHKIWNDLWRDSVEIETFLTFFFEVQCDTSSRGI